MSSDDTSNELLTSIHLPQSLDATFSQKPKLTREQCGHLRHFHNLASLPDGDWSLMGSQDSLQEHDTSYRYQLSAMSYAAGAAHYHHLPAMRSMFQPLIRKLISKMLRREVWGYWYMTSQSGVVADPDLKKLRKPWADPVCRENIMYSCHLLLMVSLFSMLFNDDSFDKPGSIAFDWDPIFFGLGPERFEYDRGKLQETVLKEMERGSWMGACCEPNMVFIVCNQFPLIAMRYNDVFNNTNVIDEVLPKYKAAIGKKQTTRKYMGPVFGHVAQGMSEVVGSPDLDAYLLHADTYLRPTWSKGGLHYARCDQYWDNEGNYTYGEPYTSNAVIGYARLNVKGGQKRMWDHPWTRNEVQQRPWVDGLGFETDVDCLRGSWDDNRKAMNVVLRTWNGSEVNLKPAVRNLRLGTYGLYVDKELRTVVSWGDQVLFELKVGGQDVEFVVLRASAITKPNKRLYR